MFTPTTGEPLGYPTWLSTWGRAGKAVAKARKDTAAKAREGTEERSKPHCDTVVPGVETHALRHFYASALIAGGASVKVVQMRLGHGSAVVTLDTYGHLWPDDDDLTRTVMDAALGTREYKLSTVEVV